MDISTHLHTVLTQSSPTSLGAAIYPVIAPPKTTGRHCVFQVVRKKPDEFRTQEGDPEGTRAWTVQLMFYAPKHSDLLADLASVRNFLVPYKDWPTAPGIMRVYEVNSMERPITSTTRLFAWLLEVDVTENLL